LTGSSEPPDERRWNHNIHYHRLLLDAVPPGARTALDVGCGEGMLARALRRRVADVWGIDLDAAGIELARAQDPREEIRFIHGDVLTYPFEPQSFDVVTAVATLHHLDTVQTLTRLSGLVRPAGVLGVVGLARRRLPGDLPLELAGAVATRVLQRRRGLWQHPSPIVWPPPDNVPQLRRIVAQLLPGARFRRHVLWRYSVIWSRE
jgi:2-polyprenyl-3-methyl-5-hydroxy-6-metoxy-1,4-benzoquinol methylase